MSYLRVCKYGTSLDKGLNLGDDPTSLDDLACPERNVFPFLHTHSQAHYYITTGMSHTLAFYGKTGDLIKFTDSVDFMQNNLKCCGLNGPSDYSDYYNATFWVNSGNETVRIIEQTDSEPV